MKGIRVVADKKYSSFTRKFVHDISKKEEFKAAYYKTKQGFDNEPRWTGKNYELFIGENEISKDFIPLIDIKFIEIY